jgi:hypothetical protein
MFVPYVPGKAPPPKLPLERFMPPIPQWLVKTWCQEQLNPGDWVLDPFGYNPLVPIEIAGAGNPVLVTANNPIHGFMLKVLASAPQRKEFTAALQDLAVTPKGDDRMESYIRRFYNVQCEHCNHQIEADAFLWNKDDPDPFAALIDCPHCGSKGKQTLDQDAIDKLTPLPSVQIHRARALSRIADLNDPLRSQVENALNAYPARPLIILQTMINAFERLRQTARRHELLTALILSAADQGNTLWAYPSPRNRPRQLVIPSVFQENNLWKAMENAIPTWQVLQAPISIHNWHEHAETDSGIFLFEGRLKALDPLPEKDFFSAVLNIIPRPNQAFWTLCTLWTGWIWGKDAVDPIRQVLSRQRYDWNWHTNALRGIFNELFDIGDETQQIWGLVPENEPMLILATLLAAESVGFRLQAFAQSMDDQLAQCYWEKGAETLGFSQPDLINETARQSITSYLKEKGEPAAYEQVHAAAVTGLANENKLANDIFLQNKNQAASETQRWVETPFQDSNFLVRVAGGTSSLETGDWWLANASDTQMSLIDRVEKFILNTLINSETITAQRLKEKIYQAFPGILTPTDDVLLNCLESYADLIDKENHIWQLRPGEQPAERRGDILAIERSLHQIAQRLGYRSVGRTPIHWYDQDQKEPKFCLHLFSTARIARKINEEAFEGAINIIILPGSRANLLAFKKHRDPVLSDLLDKNFLIVKFRAIRGMEANPLLTRALFAEQIRSDPPEYRTSQLALF